MHWNDHYRYVLQECLKSDVTFPAGAASTFIALDNEVGVKLFPSPTWRDFARLKQQQVATMQLAPQVGDPVDLQVPRWPRKALNWNGPFGPGRLLWGYMTQCAEINATYDVEEKKKVISALKAESTLCTPEDLEEQDDNFGVVDGHLVYIDFDHGSWNVELEYPCS